MDKPWITSGSQKSISIKNHCLSKFIKMKDPDIRTEAHKNTENTGILYRHYFNKVNNPILLNFLEKTLKTSKYLEENAKHYFPIKF